MDFQKVLIGLCGVVLGGLLGISVKYPVTKENVKTAQEICRGKEYLKFKIGIAGKIYEVTCDDKQTYHIK